ncbi:DUF6804 family protein [bacterium endosymbiont of Bathymodiolus sp. 5 South]|jgi:hypothetical protein|uniref:DUF6804 family protein n=1 Tax=bacterium endosymbiont of Bathymodiolus sp. 5 South TaxID=1181670 RepID=UPI00111A9C3A|nr:DUF6804 family protein [bacterium endosymbiont of Bathymodiolus sp. 5 South]CAC9438335.1 hypothetical protein [uncultured Gammaproteobacteria bacterium]VVH55660.1 hypothetical protein BSPCLSOX_901 [uncultured Gammaproteobacteria bacterium]VVH61538.1 hypothetical protein BSPWISOX_2150 [uncultured Gammaproteobacteria bacterium]VVM23745.1 hypothetical protein BSPWISOXPB_8316 [uncultured Gammaproteobacteria bacterium]
MPKPLIYIAAGFLLIGVFPLPYGYYMLLRFIACGVFAWAAYIAFERNEDILPWVFIVLAIIFNPILKIHFPKEMWVVIDFFSGIFLILIREKIQENDKQST